MRVDHERQYKRESNVKLNRELVWPAGELHLLHVRKPEGCPEVPTLVKTRVQHFRRGSTAQPGTFLWIYFRTNLRKKILTSL